MTLKKIIWTGPDRMLPGIGIAVPGSEFHLEKGVANSFIKQGLATEETEVKVKSTKAKKEVN